MNLYEHLSFWYLKPAIGVLTAFFEIKKTEIAGSIFTTCNFRILSMIK